MLADAGRPIQYAQMAIDDNSGKPISQLESNLRVHKGVNFNIRVATSLGVMNLAEVRLQEGESLENALRRFKRKVQTEDIIKDVKRHSYYLKPGEKRRLKQALARKRARKKIRREPD